MLNLCVFVNFFVLSHIRNKKLVSELLGFRILVRKLSALNVKIYNRTRGSGVTLPKLTAHLMYGLGLALSYLYNAYLCIPISIKPFLSPVCGRSKHTISEPH